MIKKNWKDVKGIRSDAEGFKGMIQHFLWTKEDGCPNFAMRLMAFEPYGYTSYHAHLEDHQFFILEGEAAIVDPGGKETKFKAGDTAYIPPDEPQQVKNVGERCHEGALHYSHTSGRRRESSDPPSRGRRLCDEREAQWG